MLTKCISIPWTFVWIIFALSIEVLLSCKEEVVPKTYAPKSDHEEYQASLDQVGLLETALGADWLKSSKSALYDALPVELPFEEAFYFDPSQAQSTGYRFMVKRGQKIQIGLDWVKIDSFKLFADLFRVVDDSLKLYRHVASTDRILHQLGFESRRDGSYILRIQPELLRGGKLKILIETVPTLAFPVQGKDKRAIGSFFGDPRDGGRRKHHGVDIFAKRHTPIIAPTDGFVRFAGVRGIGGRVIWFNDYKRDQTLYFAHLEKIFVSSRTSVSAGDTLGTVGNSGNARTTPTHLHFGIYSSGPIDPMYHIIATNNTKRSEIKDLQFLGSYVRTKQPSFAEIYGEGSKSKLTHLQMHQLMKVQGVSDSWLRIEFPNGSTGTININFVELAQLPIQVESVSGQFALLESPLDGTVSKEILKAGDQFLVYGTNENYWYVKNSWGSMGWIVAP